jgi:hypothetical protein
MFLLFADPSAFWHDQCYNPHAHEHAELYAQHLPSEPWSPHLPCTLLELARGLTVRASQNLPNAWARAFGHLRDTCIWSYAPRRPDEVPVLVLGPISYTRKYVNNHDLLMHDVPVLAPATLRAQVWAFRCIRAAALARWLRAVGVVMSRAQWGDVEEINEEIHHASVVADVTEIVLAQLASWHAALPHDEALPRPQPWVGV